MTTAELLALPVAMDLVTAGRALGLGRTLAFELARAGEFPVPVLRLGTRYRVTRADLLKTLGLDPDTPISRPPGPRQAPVLPASEILRRGERGVGRGKPGVDDQADGEAAAEPRPCQAPDCTGQINVGMDALELFTVPEVAKLLRLSEATVWRRVHDGDIASIKVGAARRITPASVTAFVRSQARRRQGGGWLMKIPEAAGELAIGVTKFYELVNAGEIRTIRLGPNAVRVPLTEIEAYIARNLA
jgi:excisionase family DNA binding protein